MDSPFGGSLLESGLLADGAGSVADISFGPNRIVTFPTKYHGDVSLSRDKWDRICSEPERFYYRYNGDKVATTLVAPDFVRHHKDVATQFFYYKRFEKFVISENIEGPFPCKLMVVVIDTETQRICTVYPTDKPKPGSKELKK
jgi:hypothetical protein